MTGCGRLWALGRGDQRWHWRAEERRCGGPRVRALSASAFADRSFASSHPHFTRTIRRGQAHERAIPPFITHSASSLASVGSKNICIVYESARSLLPVSIATYEPALSNPAPAICE
jgi:hypothetical protein